MLKKKMLRRGLPVLLLVAALLPANLLACNGSDAFLHYVRAPAALRVRYQAVCKSIVLSDGNSGTLKNAKAELDSAMPKILGASTLPVADGRGALSSAGAQ